MKKVGYLGPQGTFSEVAAKKHTAKSMVEMTCYDSFPAIVSAVEKGEINEAVVPLENSTEGAVNQIMDLIAQSPAIKFCGEVIIDIRHSLLARPEVQKSQIRKVLSHPQVLAQCREYLNRELPHVDMEETGSSARAAGIVAQSQECWAAVGTELAAEKYGLAVLAADIQDSAENATRFIVLGLSEALCEGDCRTSLIVAIKDRPGALYGILREFALREINLTRIESRPEKKKLGRYLFFIDLEGHRNDAVVRDAINAIAGMSVYLRVLGSYPRDNSFKSGAGAGSRRVPADLTEARKEIDLVDSQIVELIGIRTGLVEKIGAMKKDVSNVKDAGREREVIRRVRETAARKGAHPDMVEDVFKLMMSRFVRLQEGMLKGRDQESEAH